jgi:hypothetical protein
VEVLGGVRTRGLEGGRPLKCKDFNPNCQFGLKYLHFVWTSEPLAIVDEPMEEAVKAVVECEGGKRLAKEVRRAKRREKTSSELYVVEVLPMLTGPGITVRALTCVELFFWNFCPRRYL